jgi:hypothetical protein
MSSRGRTASAMHRKSTGRSLALHLGLFIWISSKKHNFEVHQHREVQLEETIPQSRVLRSSRLKTPRVSTETAVKPIIGPIKKPIVEVSTDPDKNDAVQPIKIDRKSSNFNKFEVDPIKSWIGKQLKDQTISQSILSNVSSRHTTIIRMNS